MAHHETAIWGVVSAAAMALAGCTFGDESPQQAQSVVGPWFDQNCVPAECMLQCCEGWNYDGDPSLRGGEVYGPQCEKVRKQNAAYAEYVALMLEIWNKCSSEFAAFEGGTCFVTEPPDVIEGFRPDGQPVYSGLSFLVCSPKGQIAAYPVEDVELIPQE